MDTNQLDLDAARLRKNERKSAASEGAPVVKIRESATTTAAMVPPGASILPIDVEPSTEQPTEQAGEHAVVEATPAAAVAPVSVEEKPVAPTVAESVSEKKDEDKKVKPRVPAWITRALERAREKAAKEKRKREDEKQKTANTKRKNHTKYIAAAIVIATICAGAFMQYRLKEAEETVKAQAEEARKRKEAAVKQAASMLDGSGQGTPAPQSTVHAAAQLAAPAAAPAANPAGSNMVQVPAYLGAEDKYLAQLRQLKDGISVGQEAPTGPSRLPPEISRAEIPSPRGGSTGGTRAPGQASHEPQRPQISETIEGNTSSGKDVRPDPLDRVSVVGTVSVDRTAAVPYSIKTVRMTEDGMAAFIYPRSGDPLIFGRWYFEGDATPEGWTIVKVERNHVKVVSPTGKVYQLQS